MTFEKDIFISYAHIDDEPLVEGERGWVSEFHRSLEVRLAQLLGYKPKIWRDTDLDGNHVFSEEIISQFPKIAVMISVISPRYVQSDWCVKEVHEFIDASMKNIGLTIQNRSRIFKAIKTPVSLDLHPVPIREVLGYEFFRLDPERKKVSEFSRVFGQQAQIEYWTRLNDIAQDIATILEEMKKQADVPGAAPASKGKVYLAEAAYDLAENREAIRRELLAQGYEVLPDRNLPLVAGLYREAVSAMMRECKLILHLAGGRYGVVPEESEKSITQLQAEISAEVSREKNILRLFWLSGDAPQDQRQEQFISLLRTDEKLCVHADIVEASLEDFKFTVRDKLERLDKPAQPEPAPAAQPAAGAPSRIYLICDKQDLGETGPIEDFLFNNNCDVILPVFEGDLAQLRNDHQENLKFCDAVLIYYGQGNELWLRSMMRDLVKAAGYGRSSPLDKKAVYVAGPASPQKERFRTHEAVVISGLGGKNEQGLHEFLKTVNKT
ncbi:MAG: hypothetical protein FD123_3819 [Bacteroidetes bacterium]|nr:MAG: hypothetical protein FD123_3819 [Bacteroidota bacterium]